MIRLKGGSPPNVPSINSKFEKGLAMEMGLGAAMK
jgi:hypothetical protein